MKINYFLLFLLLYITTLFAQEKPDVFDIARKGTLAQAKAAFNNNPKAFFTINKDGYSPLILACYRGNTEVAQFLIENGSDINGSSSMGTPLMAAVFKGNLEIVKLLLANNANINMADGNGTTALIYAVQFQNKTVLSLLLENKADKTHKSKEGKTAFEYAVFAGNDEIINLLK